MCPSLADLGLLFSGSVEIKLGKNRTEAEVKRYTEEKERLEKKKEEIRGHLAQLRKEKRELRETMLKCTGEGPPRWGGQAAGLGSPREETGSVPLRAAHEPRPHPPAVRGSGGSPALSSPTSCLKCGCSVRRPSDLLSAGR